MAAPRPASVGANAAASSNPTITGIAGNTNRAPMNPATTVSGSPTSSSRTTSPRSPSICRGRTCAASWNKINARVTSATALTSTAMSATGTGATAEITAPAITNAIGAVTYTRPNPRAAAAKASTSTAKTTAAPVTHRIQPRPRIGRPLIAHEAAITTNPTAADHGNSPHIKAATDRSVVGHHHR